MFSPPPPPRRRPPPFPRSSETGGLQGAMPRGAVSPRRAVTVPSTPCSVNRPEARRASSGSLIAPARRARRDVKKCPGGPRMVPACDNRPRGRRRTTPQALAADRHRRGVAPPRVRGFGRGLCEAGRAARGPRSQPAWRGPVATLRYRTWAMRLFARNLPSTTGWLPVPSVCSVPGRWESACPT